MFSICIVHKHSLFLFSFSFSFNFLIEEDRQGWKPKPKLKPENPVLKEILETQTSDECLKTGLGLKTMFLRSWSWLDHLRSWS